MIALIATVVGLVLAEVILRVVYPTVPSLAPLTAADLTLRPFDWDQENRKAGRFSQHCMEDGGRLVPNHAQVVQRPGALSLWVSGDSLAYGIGATDNRGFADRLQEALEARLSRPVDLLNLGSPGGDYCSSLGAPLSALKGLEKPDLLVVELFADDLEDRASVTVGGRLVLLPQRIKHPVGRWLAWHSYAANLVWYAARPEDHVGLVRLVDEAGRADFRAAVRGLVERTQAEGIGLVIALVEPAGMPQCAPDPPETSRCRWLPGDLDLIASLLKAEGVPFVDLRRFWDGRPDRRARNEVRRDFLRVHGMAIHPDDLGHQELAEALLAPSLAALGDRGVGPDVATLSDMRPSR